MRARLACAIFLAIALSLLLGSTPSASQTRLTIAASVGPGFFAYDLMTGFAQILSRNVPNLTAVTEQSQNFLETMQRIAAGRAQIGIVGSVIVVDAALGEEAFRGSRFPVRTLAVLHDFVFNLVTFEDTGIRTIGDLRGKRVGIGGPGDVRDAMRALRAAGIDPGRDVRMEVSQVPGAWVAALREKRIDAAFAASLGSPIVPDINDLASTPGIRLRIIPMEGIVPILQREFGTRYHLFTIPRGIYPGMTTDVGTFSAGAYLIGLESLDPTLAYQITKQFYDRRGELAQFSYAAQYVTVTGLAGRAVVPFHPGSVRYFRERGLPGF